MVCYFRFSFCSGIEVLIVQAIDFDGFKEDFRTGVVIGTTGTAYAMKTASARAARQKFPDAILTAKITMKDQLCSRCAILDCLVESCDCPFPEP